jgi:hypothetical protein
MLLFFSMVHVITLDYGFSESNYVELIIRYRALENVVVATSFNKKYCGSNTRAHGNGYLLFHIIKKLSSVQWYQLVVVKNKKHASS